VRRVGRLDRKQDAALALIEAAARLRLRPFFFTKVLRVGDAVWDQPALSEARRLQRL
jgi:hypothetical protein